MYLVSICNFAYENLNKIKLGQVGFSKKKLKTNHSSSLYVVIIDPGSDEKLTKKKLDHLEICSNIIKITLGSLNCCSLFAHYINSH